MADYTSSLTGAEIDAGINKAALLPAISGGDATKVVAVNAAENAFELVDGGFPSGTSMLFNQASAPTGWTKKSDWANTASLLVGNTYASGGSDDPVTWTTALVSASHVLTEAELPSHTHGAGTFSAGSDGDHSHTTANGAAFLTNGSSGGMDSGSGYTYQSATNTDGAHTHTISGTSGASGSGSGHDHTLTQDTYTPRYVTIIAASKDA